jgi:hypothetical protein
VDTARNDAEPTVIVPSDNREKPTVGLRPPTAHAER